MVLNVRRFSKHAEERMVEAYKASPKVAGVLALINKNASKNMVEFATGDEIYVLIPGEGAFVVKGDTVVTFIHKSRIGAHGECQRAYARFSKVA